MVTKCSADRWAGTDPLLLLCAVELCDVILACSTTYKWVARIQNNVMMSMSPALQCVVMVTA